MVFHGKFKQFSLLLTGINQNENCFYLGGSREKKIYNLALLSLLDEVEQPFIECVKRLSLQVQDA